MSAFEVLAEGPVVKKIGTKGCAPPVPATPCNTCEAAALAICADLSLEQRARVLGLQGQVRLAPHKTLFREGDAADNVYSVGTGTMKLYKLLCDGRRQITGFLFPGDFFGLSHDGFYAYTAEAIGPVTLCRFPRQRMERLFDEMPHLEKRLLARAIHELAAAQDQMLLLGRKTAREKVASFLVILAVRARRAGHPAAIAPLPMNRSDIGDYLGLTIETVSRILSVLKRDGLIDLPESGMAVLKQPETLERIAEGR